MMKDGAILNKGTLDEIISTMPEKVWNCIVPQQSVSAITKRYKVSNMKSENHGVDLRIISAEKPCETAVYVQPSLEDVFLYYFGEKVGDENDTL